MNTTNHHRGDADRPDFATPPAGLTLPSDEVNTLLDLVCVPSPYQVLFVPALVRTFAYPGSRFRSEYWGKECPTEFNNLCAP